jgi:hypothetical protein
MAGIVTILCGAGGFGLASAPLGDNSFLWHLRTGGWILDHGIPRGDPYSFSVPGTRWIAQSWLAELIYGALDRAIGAFAIRFVIGLAGACVAVFLYRIAFHTTRDRVRALGLLIPALACSFTVASARPLMFGLVLLGLLVFTVEVPASAIGRHPRAVVPIIMWLWVNVHGTFSLGFLYLALVLVGRRLEGASPMSGRERDLLVGTAIAAVLVFVNPYGPSLVFFPLALMGRSQVLRNVSEWESVDLHTLTGFLYATWLCISVFALSRSRPRRSDLLMSFVFLLLGWWAVRNVAIAVAVTMPIVGRALCVDRTPSAGGPEATAADRREAAGVAPPILAVLVCLVSALLVVRAATQPDFDLKRYPVASMAALASQHRLGGRLLTTDAWAGYVIYKYWPEQHVFFDDRYDMYPIALTDAYNTVLSLQPGWQRVLDEYRINVIVWPREKGIVQVLDHLSGWTKLRQDNVASVFVRTRPQG